MTDLNKQLLDIYFKGINDERRSKFINEVSDNPDKMTFLNRLFLIIHKLMSICVMPLLKLIKNLENDLTALEEVISRHSDENHDNLENFIRLRFMKTIVNNLKSIDIHKEIVTKFYTEETVFWLYSCKLNPSDKLDDILNSFTAYIKQPFIKLHFDKQLYYVCRNILSKENENNSLTSSNYIRGEIINLFNAYIPYNEYYLNIWFLNDENFMKSRLIELFIDFNDLDHDDANVFQNQTLEILKNFKNNHFFHNDSEIAHRFSHLLIECFNTYYTNYIGIIKYLHKLDFNIPFTLEDSQTVRRISLETSIINAKWYQKQLYGLYDFIYNTQVIQYLLYPGTKEKFIIGVGNLLKNFQSEERKELKLVNYDHEDVFDAIQHLFNIYTIFYRFVDDTQFRKGLVEETRFIHPDYIKKMLDILLKKNKILLKEHEKVSELPTYIISEREKQTNELDDDEIPEEFLDPIMGSMIEDPVYLPNTDIIMERDVIFRHLLENQHNPFNRDPLTKKELEEYNKRDDILEKLLVFNDKKKHYMK